MDTLFGTMSVVSQATLFSVAIATVLNVLFYEAIKAGASDIHIEPDDLFVRIRLRIDGVLMNKVILHKNYWSGLCVRLKVLSGMNIAESRKPQDGGISMVIQGREVDFRVSNIPTIYGENIVIRILDKSHNLATLDSLGFSEKNLKLIELEGVKAWNQREYKTFLLIKEYMKK